ncbi:hypothetical protein BKA66DRAFT_575978 [Pyrenochaeta sp. MPI-SDFR-AT-0127]|nr:hypothetical protein BKA66DRAFT_575978 [Pyrenochaeta sp. MPI-SDFR-AT-0127]
MSLYRYIIRSHYRFPTSLDRRFPGAHPLCACIMSPSQHSRLPQFHLNHTPYMQAIQVQVYIPFARNLRHWLIVDPTPPLQPLIADDCDTKATVFDSRLGTKTLLEHQTTLAKHVPADWSDLWTAAQQEILDAQNNIIRLQEELNHAKKRNHGLDKELGVMAQRCVNEIDKQVQHESRAASLLVEKYALLGDKEKLLREKKKLADDNRRLIREKKACEDILLSKEEDHKSRLVLHKQAAERCLEHTVMAIEKSQFQLHGEHTHRIQELKAQNQELKAQLQVLEIQHQELNTKNHGLEAKHREVELLHAELRARYIALDGTHKGLKGHYEELAARYDDFHTSSVNTSTHLEYTTCEHNTARAHNTQLVEESSNIQSILSNNVRTQKDNAAALKDSKAISSTSAEKLNVASSIAQPPTVKKKECRFMMLGVRCMPKFRRAVVPAGKEENEQKRKPRNEQTNEQKPRQRQEESTEM